MMSVILLMFLLIGGYAAATGATSEEHGSSFLNWTIFLITIVRIWMEIRHNLPLGDNFLIRTREDKIIGKKSFEKHFLASISSILWVYYTMFSMEIFSLESPLILLSEVLHFFIELGAAIFATYAHVVEDLDGAVLAAASFSSGMESGVQIVGFLACFTSLALHYWPIRLMVLISRREVPVDRISKKDAVISLGYCMLWILYGVILRDIYVVLAHSGGAMIAVSELVFTYRQEKIEAKEDSSGLEIHSVYKVYFEACTF